MSFELVVSAAEDGTTNVIWDLTFDADDLELDVAPSSDIFPPGGSLAVAVSGLPMRLSLSGDLASSFNLTTLRTTTNSDISPGVRLTVDSMLDVCSVFEIGRAKR